MPPTYDEPTVMWRMRRPNGQSSHAVLGFEGRGGWVIWFLNDRPIGIRDFETWQRAFEWSEQLQLQNWSVGWRDVVLPTS